MSKHPVTRINRDNQKFVQLPLYLNYIIRLHGLNDLMRSRIPPPSPCALWQPLLPCLMHFMQLYREFSATFSATWTGALRPVFGLRIIRETTEALSPAKAGFPPSEYSGHSFRRGGCTTAFQIVFPAPVFKLRGDWKSQAHIWTLHYHQWHNQQTPSVSRPWASQPATGPSWCRGWVEVTSVHVHKHLYSGQY